MPSRTVGRILETCSLATSGCSGSWLPHLSGAPTISSGKLDLEDNDCHVLQGRETGNCTMWAAPAWPTTSVSCSFGGLGQERVDCSEGFGLSLHV